MPPVMIHFAQTKILHSIKGHDTQSNGLPGENAR